MVIEVVGVVKFVVVGIVGDTSFVWDIGCVIVA